MEQEAQRLSWWQAAQHQFSEDTEKSMCILDISLPHGNSGVHISWNNDQSDIQHFPQCSQLENIPLVFDEAPRQNATEVGSQFSMLVPEHDLNFCPEATLTPSQMIYYQDMSPSQPGMIFQEPQMMPLVEPDMSEVAMTFSGNLRMSPNEPPVSAPSGISVTLHISAPTTPYSGPPTESSDRDSLTPKMSLAPTMPSMDSQAMLPSLAQMLPPRDPHNYGIPPSLLTLESPDSFVSQPASQEDTFLPEQHIPAPQKTKQNFQAQERVSGRRSVVLKPHCCPYENCGRVYTKRSHLLSHQRKHTGERSYKCRWEGCLSSFFRSDELGRHMRTHTGDRPHTCDQCNRQFMRSDHLRQHQRIHQRMSKSPKLQAINGDIAGPPAPGL